MRAWLVVLLLGALLCGCLALGKGLSRLEPAADGPPLGPIAQ
jgi:hypothetical protein